MTKIKALTRLEPALGLVGLLLALAVWVRPLSAQGWDQDYEKRAQEVLENLVRLNSLRGWAPQAPATWPESPARPDNFTPERPAQGVRWDRSQAPARLTSLLLANQGLSRAADFSGLTSLERLEVYGNHLRGLNLAGDSALANLMAQHNQLTTLQLEETPALTTLALSGNKLTRLELAATPHLKELSISQNQLKELDLSHNRELVSLQAANNHLTTLDLSPNQALTHLTLSYNQLTGLDLSGQPHLTELAVRGNQLTSLDLRPTPKLAELAVSRNQLTSLDISPCPHLTSLDAAQNPLTSLTLGDNPLAGLLNLNLDGGRLPLSQLLPLVGRAQRRNHLGSQDKVFFEHLRLDLGATLDLSSEAQLGGSATIYTVLTDKKRRVKPEVYHEEGGRLTFLQPGRYLVMMTNDSVLDANRLSGHQRRFKVKAHTGLVEVAAPGGARP
ncbi:MAG: hypothetical protein LBP55_00815 [Candidatus Adiutrix sp.]|jgi:hypothetical protein|nr:hypothetical protein [Candidatus Adiutrix sp.]